MVLNDIAINMGSVFRGTLCVVDYIHICSR